MTSRLLARPRPVVAASVGFLLITGGGWALAPAGAAAGGGFVGASAAWGAAAAGGRAPAALTQAIRVDEAAPLGWRKSRQTAELTGSGGASGDLFGYSVSLSANGSIALVGAHGADDGTGAAYVFTDNGGTWTQTAELTAADGVEGDSFGHSVALSADGSTALIGANDAAGGMGAAYVFTDNGGTWTQTAELTAADGIDGDAFGYSVALSAKASTAVIGDLYQNNDTGAAYVFHHRRTTWKQSAELTPSDGADGDFFGAAVAVSKNGSTALVGAFGHTLERGSAYVFAHSGKSWTQAAELSASDGAPNDEFGYSVALSGGGSTAVVGADGHAEAMGAAYVFADTAGGWAQSAELTASDGIGDDTFGNAVAVSAHASTILVGAFGRQTITGAAYVFTDHGGSWKQATELTAPDGAEFASFGWSAALSTSGSTALIGAIGNDNRVGATYVEHK